MGVQGAVPPDEERGLPPHPFLFIFFISIYYRGEHIYELALFWYQKRGLYSVLI
jgi:hypothetical protein